MDGQNLVNCPTRQSLSLSIGSLHWLSRFPHPGKKEILDSKVLGRTVFKMQFLNFRLMEAIHFGFSEKVGILSPIWDRKRLQMDGSPYHPLDQDLFIISTEINTQYSTIQYYIWGSMYASKWENISVVLPSSSLSLPYRLHGLIIQKKWPLLYALIREGFNKQNGIIYIYIFIFTPIFLLQYMKRILRLVLDKNITFKSS